MLGDGGAADDTRGEDDDRPVACEVCASVSGIGIRVLLLPHEGEGEDEEREHGRRNGAVPKVSPQVPAAFAGPLVTIVFSLLFVGFKPPAQQSSHPQVILIHSTTHRSPFPISLTAQFPVPPEPSMLVWMKPAMNTRFPRHLTQTLFIYSRYHCVLYRPPIVVGVVSSRRTAGPNLL